MRHLLARFLSGLYRFFWQSIYREYSSRYDVSPSFRFNGAGIWLYGTGRIELGEDGYIGEHSSIQAAQGCTVRIGRRCMIASNVHIYTQSAQADSDFRIDDGAPLVGDVAIGDGVWIGANVFVGPRITVGANSVIGANSVVSKSIPSDEIWGGVPARFIRSKAALDDHRPATDGIGSADASATSGRNAK